MPSLPSAKTAIPLLMLALAWASACRAAPSRTAMIDGSIVDGYVDAFNRGDKETIANDVDNAHAGAWVRKQVPYFTCPDKDIEEIYYFRWWVFRKHLVRTPEGYVVTEFLPHVAHEGKYGTIVAAAGLHVDEARWLHDAAYVRDYCRFWYKPECDDNRARYANWLTSAVLGYCRTRGDAKLAVELLPRLVADFRIWDSQHRHESGLYWNSDNRDGGEYSISGPGLRPTHNSYMYANARAIAEVANMAGDASLAAEFETRAAELQRLVLQRLWDPSAHFFKTIPMPTRETPGIRDFASIPTEHNVREIYGFLPWTFRLVPDEPAYGKAWQQALDPAGFASSHGLTTAEQRHPRFMTFRVKRCQWDGPVWPFTTSLVLRGMANYLTGYTARDVTSSDYLDALRTYARSQHRTTAYGERVPWIGENIHPQSGIWLAQAIVFELGDPIVGKDLYHGFERGKDYNHSSYCDLVISDLIGLKSRWDDILEVNPLVPEGTWPWFCLENVPYHGRNVSIIYDRDGTKFRKGRGLLIFVDGALVAKSDRLTRMLVEIGAAAKQGAARDRSTLNF